MPTGLALAISLLIVLLFSAYIVSMLINFFSPFYTTPKKILKTVVKNFNLKENQTFADLGSGDGRVIFETSRMYKCLSIGYEISPVPLMIAKLKKLFLASFNKNIQIRGENFFNVDFKDLDVIYCCLPTNTLSKLEKKFEKELKKGSVVFTYRNRLLNKKGKKTQINDVFLYRYTY